MFSDGIPQKGDMRALPDKAECVRRLREAMAEGHFDPASAESRCVRRILRRSAQNTWKPTPPQVQNMQRILGELGKSESLIDWGDTGHG